MEEQTTQTIFIRETDRLNPSFHMNQNSIPTEFPELLKHVKALIQEKYEKMSIFGVFLKYSKKSKNFNNTFID